MLVVERKKGQIHFRDDEREGFFTATIHQPEDSEAFEVNVSARGNRRKSRSVFTSQHRAPTLHAAGQIVISEYILADAAVESDDCTLVAAFWLDQLDGGLRWRLQAEDMEIVDDEDDEDDWDDDDPDPGNDGGGDIIRMIGRISQS